MGLIVTIGGSPAQLSRSGQVGDLVGRRLIAAGFQVETINARELPPEDLIYGRIDSPALKPAFALLERADGVVITTPIYKASFTGVLKSFLDVLPQFGLTGKVVLPLATGGTLAHVLAIDYGLRPVLASLGAAHVVNGLFLLDKLIERSESGALNLDPELSRRLDGVVDDFARAVRRARVSV